MTSILALINGIRGYLILALVAVAVGLVYGWGEYRQGYRDHETFAKLQTAVLNEAARQKEQALQAQVTIWTPNTTRNTKMPRKLLLSCALMLLPAIAGCPSVSGSQFVPPNTPKPPAWTMERHEPTLTDRMLKILSE